MRSTCSIVAMPSATTRSASSPNGRPQRLTRNPGPSEASITRLPIAAPVPRARASAASPDCSPATTSSRRMSGAGLKKCMPTTRSGPGTAAARSVTDSDEVLVASTHVGSTTSASSPEQLALELQRLGDGLDDQRARGQRLEAVDRLHACGRGARVVLAPAPALGALGQPRRRAARRPCSSASGDGVEQQRAGAGQRGELGDARAHRPGADDADGRGDRARRLRRPRSPCRGTSALMPVGGAADDQLLDLRRALVQGGDAHVAEVALDRMVVDVARRRRGPGWRCWRTPPRPRSRRAWRSRSRWCWACPCPSGSRRARRASATASVCRTMSAIIACTSWKRGDRAPELLALLGVRDRLLDAALADADAAGGDASSGPSPATSSRP